MNDCNNGILIIVEWALIVALKQLRKKLFKPECISDLWSVSIINLFFLGYKFFFISNFLSK